MESWLVYIILSCQNKYQITSLDAFVLHSNINNGIKKTTFFFYPWPSQQITLEPIIYEQLLMCFRGCEVLMQRQRTAILSAEANRYILVLHLNEYIYFFALAFIPKKTHNVDSREAVFLLQMFISFIYSQSAHIWMDGCRQSFRFSHEWLKWLHLKPTYRKIIAADLNWGQ